MDCRRHARWGAPLIDQTWCRDSGLLRVGDDEFEALVKRRAVGEPLTGEPLAGGALTADAVTTERARVDPDPVRRAVTACPELECVRHRLPPGIIAAAEQRALALGVGADRVLIAARAMTEDAYVVALAARLRVAFESLDNVARVACPLPDARLMDADVTGLLPLRIAGELVWVIAPRGLAARRLSALIGSRPALAARIRLTSSRRLRSFVIRHGASALSERAANALRARRPELSAAPRRFRHRLLSLAAVAMLAGVAVALPGPATTATSALLLLTFLAWTALRLIGAATRWHRWPALRLRPGELPVYTLIIALYDEAAAAAGLVAALRRLDYPLEKLDIKLVLEPDDAHTRATLDALGLGPPFEIVVAPNAGPRTKPKALNAALALARGTFTAVFDAEDRPEPDQLRRALDAFLAADADTACVQARLTIDNTRDGWLARGIMAQTPPTAWRLT